MASPWHTLPSASLSDTSHNADQEPTSLHPASIDTTTPSLVCSITA
ncbi:Uncharacterised protein [Vibrio cholerae]|nr:Uncharacterised protein [Vibrio cholerae]CSI44112.1 Uncharacterised protein [Vibrio cholerae]